MEICLYIEFGRDKSYRYVRLEAKGLKVDKATMDILGDNTSVRWRI